MKVIGIDPGLSGAVAVIEGDCKSYQILSVHDIPTYSETRASGKIRRSIDATALRKLLKSIGPVDKIICERLIPPPGKISSHASFSMGFSQGVIKTVCDALNIPFFYVYPHKWKYTLQISADKELSRKSASKLFKTDAHWKRKQDHNRAEAALIALYAVVT